MTQKKGLFRFMLNHVTGDSKVTPDALIQAMQRWNMLRKRQRKLGLGGELLCGHEVSRHQKPSITFRVESFAYEGSIQVSEQALRTALDSLAKHLTKDLRLVSVPSYQIT